MKNEIQLTPRNKWCYSIGGLRDVLYAFVSMFLMVYIQYTVPLTDAQFAAIGVIMTLAKVWDAVNDPIMGAIVENSHLKAGKFRPWILWGAVLTAAITAAMFLIRINNGWGYVAFIGIIYVLWDMAFTLNDVGFWSMLPALSDEPRERDMVTTLMNIFCSVGSFLVAAVIPMVTGVDKIARYSICAVVIVTTFMATQLLTYIGVKERPRDPSETEEKITLGKMFSIIKNNDQLLWVSLVLCFYYIGSGLLLQFATNFCYFEYGYAQGGSVYTTLAVVYLLATLVSQLLFPQIAKKLSRKTIILIGTVIAVCGYALMMMFGYVLPKTMIVIILGAAFVFGGQNLMSLVILVQMTNTIEYNELKTGQRNESIIFSLRSFLAKLTSALQTLIVSFVLLVSGIKASTDNIAVLEDKLSRNEISAEEVVAQAENVIANTPDSARFILRVCMVLIPVILMIFALIFDKAKYTITEEKYDEIRAELDERHAANAAAAPVEEAAEETVAAE